MKHLIVLFLVIGLVSFAGAGDIGNSTIDPTTQKAADNLLRPFSPERTPLRDQPDDVEVFTEGFENNAEGWTTSDQTNLDTAWHKSDFMGDEEDLLWWCGDTLVDFEGEPAGYNNSWLQYLDTPVLDLSEAQDGISLTFTAYWLLEDARRVPPRDPFDGWDGWTVMISDDGGESFSPIRPESPEYDADRISAAENWWDIGPTPGWTFMSGEWDAVNDTTPEPEWVDVNFDLSEFSTDNIIIRFAIISDRAVAAPWNYYLNNSGVFIDDILIQDGQENVFLMNNCDDDPIPSDLIPQRGQGFGDYWQLTDDDQHSGEWSMWNNPEHYSLLNALDSPPFEIPEEFNTFFQFWVYCNCEDDDGNGDNGLEDFYQVFLSDDEGESWQWQATAYKRTGENDWAHYVPGIPYGDANIDLDLTDWAGETIQLRWLFRTDHDDDGGVGEGLFIDDIEVIGVDRQPRDAGMTNLTIPFPTTVGYRQSPVTVDVHNYGTRNLDNMWAKWGWDAPNGGRNYPIVPRPSLDPDSSTKSNLTDYVDNRVLGWTPSVPGIYPVWAATTVGANTPADPEDDDMATENDTSMYEAVQVWPEGIFELGYDNRSTQFAYNSVAGEGPAARFSVEDMGEESATLTQLRFMFNGMNEAANFTLHIMAEGDDETTPGAEIMSADVEVPPEETFPNWFNLPIMDGEDLIEVQGDFWVWVEFQDTLPKIVGDELIRGTDRFFNFDGEAATQYNSDLMMRAVVVTEPIMADGIAVSSLLVDFDEVGIGDIATKEVRFYSTGLEPLTVTSVEVESDIVFSVDWDGEVVLNFGEYATALVFFEPKDEEFQTTDLLVEASVDSVPRIILTGSGIMDAPGDVIESPHTFSLDAPYPNPFNSTTRIGFNLDRAGMAKVQLFDLAGRSVMTVMEGDFSAGNYTATLQGDQLPAGVYLLALESDRQTAVRKIVLMK